MYTKNEREMTEYPALAIGQALKFEHEKSNISLKDIAEQARLSYANLTALEAGTLKVFLVLVISQGISGIIVRLLGLIQHLI